MSTVAGNGLSYVIYQVREQLRSINVSFELRALLMKSHVLLKKLSRVSDFSLFFASICEFFVNRKARKRDPFQLICSVAYAM